MEIRMQLSSTLNIELLLLVQIIIISTINATLLDDYLQKRTNAINDEKSTFFGENLVLEGNEISANRCLMSVKLKEIDEGYANLSRYWPSRNFMDVRENIEQSEVFKIIRLMPKGAVLHTHGTSTASLDFIFENLINIPNLYVCFDNSTVRFRFFKMPTNDCNWEAMHLLQANDPEIVSKLKQNLSLPNAKTTPGYNTDVVWKKFRELFNIIEGLIKYKPAFQKYLERTLEELYFDNVMYLEFRGPFYEIYELNGTVHDPTEAIRMFIDTVDKFIESHPGFFGVKFIFESNRQLNHTEFAKIVDVYLDMKRKFPNFISGFDISNHEDAGHPNIYFAQKLVELGSLNTSFYFHAGETNWFGQDVDENLFDAVLLNSKRIGHGFALLKHPLLLKMTKEKNIAIEVNPISNQVLGYVADLRNHPAAYYFANNFSVIISNDNPSFYGSSGLTYDFYEAFVGIMPRGSDLRALKQLAINSINYSALTSLEKQKALEIWEKSWFKFVEYIAREHNCEKTK